MGQDTLKKILHGNFGQVGSTEKDVLDLVNPRLLVPFNILANGDDQIIPMNLTRVGLTIKAAYIVPSITSATNATNFLVLTLYKGDAVGTALTSLMVWSTDTGQEETLTAFTKASFPGIVPSTDSIAAGEGWYLKLAQTLAGVAASGCVIIEYERVN